MAERLGRRQPEVSQMERRPNVLLSTLGPDSSQTVRERLELPRQSAAR
jgi:hypothetical protein